MKGWHVPGVLILSAGLLSACTDPTGVQRDVQAFVETVPPPGIPPRITLQSMAIEPGYFEWVIDGEAVTYRSAENQDDAELTEVPWQAGEFLIVEIASPVLPADFVVVIFDELDDAGVPVDSLGTQIDCNRDRVRCWVEPTGDELFAALTIPNGSTIAVIHLSYVLSREDERGVTLLNGSWGARLTSRDNVRLHEDVRD